MTQPHQSYLRVWLLIVTVALAWGALAGFVLELPPAVSFLAGAPLGWLAFVIGYGRWVEGPRARLAAERMDQHRKAMFEMQARMWR